MFGHDQILAADENFLFSLLDPQRLA